MVDILTEKLLNTFKREADFFFGATQHNNDIQRYDIQHNDIQHNDIQHNDIQHNNKLNTTLSIMLSEWCHLR
jgi:hypothetical protein